MTIVMVTEKQDQAEKEAKAFSNWEYITSKDGKRRLYIVANDQSLLGGQKVNIVWTNGHIVSFPEPEELDTKWADKSNIGTLPIIPHTLEHYKVSVDKAFLYNIIESKLDHAHFVIWAGDPGREGNLITYLTVKQAGIWNKEKVTHKRLWFDDLQPMTIKKALGNLKPIKESYQDALAGQARQVADWIIGMTGSRLYGYYLKKYLPEIATETISVGRIVSPVLSLLYQRELAIRNFTPMDYYELEADFYHSGKLVIPEQLLGRWNGRIETKERLQNFVTRYIGEKPYKTHIVGVEKVLKEVKPPQLHNLSTLQQRMNEISKAKSTQVKEAVQKFYNNGYLTYPRTEYKHITVENYQEVLVKSVRELQKIINSPVEASIFTPIRCHVDNQKVGDHEAITTTSTFPPSNFLERCSALERAVYFEVAKTTFAMFLPNYQYEQTTIMTEVNDITFKTVGNVPVCDGWKVLWKEEELDLGDANKGDSLLPSVKEGDEVKESLDYMKKTTKAPKRYTEATLLSAMENIGRTVESKEHKSILNETAGLGTAAIRESKNKLFVTPLGEILAKALTVETLLPSPEMTAKWELFLKRISKGEKSQEEFLNNITRFTYHMVDSTGKRLSELDFGQEVARYLGEEAKCPLCGNKCVVLASGLSCTKSLLTAEEREAGKVRDCSFFIFRNQRHKSLTDSQLINLVVKKKLGKMKFLKSNSKETYTGILKLDLKEKYFVSFEFTSHKSK